MLALGRYDGGGSSPQLNRLPSRPPRAANSHSASVGRRLPAHRAYAMASSHDTCTTGCADRSPMLLPGPSGCFQLAPGVHCHHADTSSSGTGPDGGTNTAEPGTSTLASGFGVAGGSCLRISSQSGVRSAVVTKPVASTK